MSGGHGTGVEIGITQLVVDEGVEAQQQRSLPHLCRQQVGVVRTLGDGGGDEVHDRGGEPGHADRQITLQIQGHPAKQWAGQGADALRRGDRRW